MEGKQFENNRFERSDTFYVIEKEEQIQIKKQESIKSFDAWTR